MKPRFYAIHVVKSVPRFRWLRFLTWNCRSENANVIYSCPAPKNLRIAGPSPFPCCSFVCITRYETTVGFQHLKSPWSDDDHRYVTLYSKIFSVATESLRHIRLNMSLSAPRILAVLSNHIWPSSPEETSPHDKELFKRKEFERLRREEWNEFREHLEVLWECFF